MSTLYLIRHGQASAYEPVYDKLSERGEQQARILGRYLADQGVLPERVYQGPRRRHAQTCEGVAAVYRERGLAWPEPVMLDGLDEYPLQDLMMTEVPQRAQADPEYARRVAASMTRGPEGAKAFMEILSEIGHMWVSGALAKPEIVTWATFYANVRGALAEMTETEGSGEVTLAFSSAGTIAAAAGSLLQAQKEKMLELSWQLYNTSFAQVRYAPKRGRALMTLNETPHLTGEPANLTFR